MGKTAFDHLKKILSKNIVEFAIVTYIKWFWILMVILNLQNLMINSTIDTALKLQMALIVAEVYLSALPKDAPYTDFELRWSI